jgi:nucleoside-diphosphate-sugar epimerase
VAAVALITGGTGLVGTHVLRHWTVEDLEPLVVGREDCDLLKPGAATALVDRIRPAVVVHLAWSASGTRGYRTDPVNERWFDVSLELAAACRDRGSWLLATGTALDSKSRPTDAYSRSKSRLRAELTASIAAGECTWLRPYYIVDPIRRRPALVEQARAAERAGTSVVLMTPESEHDFVHAADVGTAIVCAVRNGIRGELPIGSGALRSVRDLVSALGATWVPAPGGSSLPPQHHGAADITRLREHGWSPVFTEEMFAGG